MKKLFVVFVITCLTSSIYSQNFNESWFKEFRNVIPCSDFEAGWLHKLFFGSHWRDVWTTPVRVGVIDFEKFAGGLTPTEKGGGLQTSALKFSGKDGKTYKFRPLNKDPKKNLPKELHKSVVADILQDQISSSNPYAGFVVNHILDAFGILHAGYTLAILPDDTLLGEFRKEFANILGIMEVVPDVEQFEGSDKVVGSIKLLDRLNKEFDESVDAEEFLKARLLDIFLGDWDRHKDQWKWIRFDEGDKKIYRPYPMDRDQAFDKLDGIMPWLAEQNVPQLNNFGYDYQNIMFLAWNGRYIDQMFLTFLSKDDWDKVTEEVYTKLTDDLIKNAVMKLPPEVYEIAKDELIDKMKSRRSQLKEISKEYYEHVNSIVDIYTTDKDDFISIVFNPETGIGSSPEETGKDFTMISLYKKKKEPDKKEDVFLRQKLFDNNITSEIRVYLQDGDDVVEIKGECEHAPLIRIIGGEGTDKVINSSGESVKLYDDGKKTEYSGDVNVDNDKFELTYEKPLKEYERIKDNLSKEKKDEYTDKIGNLRYDPVMPPDKFFFTSFVPIFKFDPDAGPFFGGTMNYLKFGFRMNPYLYKLQMTLGYAPNVKGIKGLVADFNSSFRGIIKRSGIDLHLRKSGIEVNNYFGAGNNSFYNESLFKSKYYRVENEKYTAELGITFPADRKLRFNFGLQFTHFRVEEKDNSISNIILFTPEGKHKVNLGYIKCGIELDGRDHITAPFKGYYLNVSGNYSPKLFNSNYEFGRITGDLRGYIGYKTAISLALRAWGEKVIGKSFPFFESAFLGGVKYLHGFPSERFAGDASLLGTAEIRLKLFTYNLLLPQTIGIFGFGETGRVFLKNEASEKWHASYGGGLFMHLINRDFTFKLTFARSDEKDLLFYFGTGFGF